MVDYTLDTQLIHAGEPRPRIEGAVSTPIFCSANFESQNESSYHDLRYIRLNNTPNHIVLHEKLAAVEKGEAGLVTSSGMAAISTTLLTVLGGGGHLLAQNCLYGGTHSLVTEDLPKLGINTTFLDIHKPASWEAALHPETKGFYVESMTNPTVQVGELTSVVEFCKKHGLISIIDNTFATPYNFRPLEHGFDLVVHSATKYLNGHSDIVAGAVIGSLVMVDKILHRLNHLGATLDPHACFLFQRGMKTLALRMERQNSNALTLARFLASRDEVTGVNYPGLKSHPDHQRASSLFRGFGGVLSFELSGGVESAQRLIERVKLPVNAPSLGGVETLITQPCRSSHSGVPREERLKIGITDSLVRVAVGIEHPDDLVADFKQALGPN